MKKIVYKVHTGNMFTTPDTDDDVSTVEESDDDWSYSNLPFSQFKQIILRIRIRNEPKDYKKSDEADYWENITWSYFQHSLSSEKYP